MRLADLLRSVDVLDIRVSGSIPADPAQVDVRAITRDSRQAGESVVYVAIRGARVDGHRFVGGLTGGVALVQQPTRAPAGVVVVQVADTRAALAPLSAALHGHPARQLRVVGLTGTNGKTTLASLCAGALDALGRPAGRIGTLGAAWPGVERQTGLTTPEAPDLHGLLAEMREQGVSDALVEVSSIALDQRRADALPFHTVVFTNLSRDHLDFHGTMEAYAAAKAQLFAPERLRPAGGLPRALLCGDDPAWRAMHPPQDRWLYGVEAHNDLHIEHVELSTRGQVLRVRVPGRAEPITVRSALVGSFNALNVTAALGVLHTLGLSWEQAADGIARVRGVPGRLERVPGTDRAGEPAVFVDYAHTPDALRAALQALRPLARDRGELSVVFGCGGDRDRGKRPDMGAVAAAEADRVVITSDNPRSEDPAAIVQAILEGVPAERRGAVTTLVDRRVAIQAAVAATRGVVLIAGKGHEKTQEICGSKIPFDDVAVAREALAAPHGAGGPMHADAQTLARATGGRVLCPAGEGPILTDTRQDLQGAWFLALSGARFDGHAYLGVAADKGAVGAVISRVPDDLDVQAWGRGLVQVGDTTTAMADLGRWARSQVDVPVVGITGSSGKTTTRALVACALQGGGRRVHQTVGNLNNHLGVPMTLLATPSDVDTLVVEMGTNAPGEIRFLAEIGRPTHRLIVNVGPAHLEELGGLDGVAVEKGAMFDTAAPGDTLVVNVDDPRIAPRVSRHPAGVRVVTWGRSELADVRLVDVSLDPQALSTTLRLHTPDGPVQATLPAFGTHFAVNATAAVATAWSTGVSASHAAAGLAAYAPVGLRQRIEHLPDGTLVLNDAYNANPASMRAALDTLAALGGTGVAALGDMLELGTHEASLHRRVAEHAVSLGLERVLLVGPRFAAVAGDLPVETFADADQAGHALIGTLGPDHRLLVKGSRGLAMERILQPLQAER